MFATFWIGRGGSRAELNQLLEYSISDNGLGDFQPSPFCDHIGVQRYEPELLGGRYFPLPIDNLRLLFHGSPFLHQLQEDHTEVPSSDCVVSLVLDTQITSPADFEIGNIKFLLLGSYDSSEVYPSFEAEQGGGGQAAIRSEST